MATRNRARPIVAAPVAPSLGREAAGVGLGVLALLIGLAVLSYDPLARSNLIGPSGAALADLLVSTLGLAALAVPIGGLIWAVAIFRGGAHEIGPVRGTALGGALLASAVAVHLAVGTWNGLEAGGLIGGFLSLVLVDGLGRAGAWLVVAAVLLLLVATLSGRTVGALGRSAGGAAARVGRGGATLARQRAARWRRGPGGDGEDVVELFDEDESAPILLRRSHVVKEPPERGRDTPPEGRRAPVVISTPPEPSPKPAARRQVEMPFQDGRAWCLPDVNLLDTPVKDESEVDHETLNASARVLEAKLATFDIRGEVVVIHPGPVITTYEFEPAAGIRVQRIVALADDLAMAMRAMSVRILAPIPGKSVVGIEVANARRESVMLREIVASDAFHQANSPLALALGKDTTGRPFAGDLARMPHLLVAGSTGSGKSVFLNTLIVSLLMRASPPDVRMVMIDPKILELAPYHEIPHLLVPVITEPKQALILLINLVMEMNDRYRVMRDKGVRNLEAYNRAVAAEKDQREVIELEADDAESADDEGEAAGAASRPGRLVHQHLPRIVVIIDELADLIMSRREVEDPITKLAQKARAAGIHLVVATQRPSVDVITGLIKANFPARIAFQVAGKVDSRTILDAMGAERLLGQGDMLFLPPGSSRLTRLHGAFVSDQEIDRITRFVRDQGEGPAYRMDLLEDPTGDSESTPVASGDEADPMYDLAVQTVVESGRASTSYVQRRLQVGYNRAARMREMMEREGVVSAPDHRGNREILARSMDE